MKHQVAVFSAFVDQDCGGNPAGVVLNADQMSETEMQAIAAEAGFPETAFVSASEVADIKLDFFTPTKRIAHCGHATVAAVSVLANQGQLGEGEHTKETVDGLRRLQVQDGKAYLEQIPQQVEPLTAEQTRQVADAVQLPIEKITCIAPPARIDNGVAFIVIALPDANTLRDVQPDFERISRISEQLGLIGFYLIAPDTEVTGRTASARMFAPFYGIDEEPATGMGAGCAAIYLHQVMKRTDDCYLIEQGRLMTPASPSLIEIRLETQGSQINRLWVGGKGKVMEQ
ncbi:PhzF family phenazine biosynthesis protein [Marinobacterium arenosum]|uniref:PhzF family phenazine biosynthesis protein n=1 Tax=Marinobacterium arenosum TaxID=2862496 RepID=UPI001C971CFB|nr:PhzF family phenazine biosynthesis protein [Marinobacterium arenosum]MBY4675336.1 PhzF family phenazine biosynthesis protein [Marinobacterium arenosum]